MKPMAEENLMSEFNSNKASLIRIDKLMQGCHIAGFENDLISKYKYLQSLMMEARYKMNSNSKNGNSKRTECDSKSKTLDKNYELYLRNPNSAYVVRRFNDSLNEFQMFLMDFMGDKGMLLADKQDDEGL